MKSYEDWMNDGYRWSDSEELGESSSLMSSDDEEGGHESDYGITSNPPLSRALSTVADENEGPSRLATLGLEGYASDDST